jgi:hypothetical protein
MKSRGFFFAAVIIVALALAPAGAYGQVPGMTLDQENEYYGWYGYAYSGWQSFTAGTNGFLGAVQLWLYSRGAGEGNSGGGAWNATLRIYEGEGTSGQILSSQAISGDGLLQRRTFVIDIPVRQAAGSKYTVYFGSATVQLTVRMSVNNYVGGIASWSDKDFNFKTHVITSDWSEEAYRDTSFTSEDTVITNASELAQFAWLVNNGYSFAGKTVTLSNDISLAGHTWTPIAAYAPSPFTFAGTFDGQGRTIRCVIAGRPDTDYQGLFGHTSGSIRNANVSDVDIAGDFFVGGVAAYCEGSVSNCTAEGRVAGTNSVGGVLGHGQALACVNRSSVAGGINVGGVVGTGARGTISGCRNEGSVTGSGYKIGGVIGEIQTKCEHCSNSGPVTGNSPAEQIGGVIGSSLIGGQPILTCTNSGAVQGGNKAGGIVGSLGVELALSINSGSVTGNTYAGGIAGEIFTGKVRDCANRGTVFATSYAGGITGYNSGMGSTLGLIINSVNTGSVNGGDNVGGLTGRGTSLAKCSNSQNSGPVSGTSLVGALAGSSHASGVFTNCYWKQTGEAPFNLAAGGGTLTLRDCRAFGTAPGTLASPVTVGGVTTNRLSAALNAWVKASWTPGCGFSSWTAGTATNYPTLVPATEVGGAVIPQTLSDSFMQGVSSNQINATVSAYVAAHPGTTATSFGSLLCNADAMGFTYGELASGNTILSFNPGLSIVGFDITTWTLTFTVSNGIDANPVLAMNRLSSAQAKKITLLQSSVPGGSTSQVQPTTDYHTDGTAAATFSLPSPPSAAFFKINLGNMNN